MDESCLDFVPTRCSISKNTAVKYQEVNYENPSKKRKQDNMTDKMPEESFNFAINPEFDIKKARFEMKKFARSNLKSSEKQKTLKELAVELGARLPRRQAAKNYKDLLAEKEILKQEELKRLNEVFQGKSTKKPWKNNNKKESRDKSRILNNYGTAKFKTNARNGPMN